MQTLHVYLNPNNALLTGYYYTKDDALPDSEARPAVLIFGGGGYRHITAKERDPIAMAYLHYGYNAFVLHYSVTEDSEGSPKSDKEHVLDDSLDDASAALSYVKEHAKEFNVDINKIAIVGFSAGGNLALRLTTFTDNKPNALILGYAASEALRELKHESILDKIDNKMPPTFMFHTAFDTIAPSSQTLKLGLKLQENGIPFESHIFLTGDHGLSLAIRNTGDINNDVAKWFDLSIRFLNTIYNKDNYIWGDLIDEKPTINTRNDILLSKKTTRGIFEELVPEHVDRMLENPFFASIPFRRYAAIMKIDSSVTEKIKRELEVLD